MSLERSLALLVGSMLVVASCGSVRNTLAQELAWDQWRSCDHFDGITLKEIRSDGEIWVSYSTGNLSAWRECIRKAREAQTSSRTTTGRVAQLSGQPLSGGTPAVPPSPAMAPVWARGDEWAFRWTSPRGKGTFVWSVDHEETVDGADYYVLRTGAQTEVFYRKSDLAWLMDRHRGSITARAHPPQIRYKWPLVPGTEWEQEGTTERPGGRSTETRVRACRIEGEETVAIQAGTFRTFKVACRNKQTDELTHQYWYAPDVKNIVREWTRFSWGVQERELIAYKLR